MIALLFVLLLVFPSLGSAASTLETTADGMAADSWAFLTTNGIDDTTFNMPMGSGPGIMTDGNFGCWDIVRQEAHFIAKNHTGTPTPVRHVVYQASTNTWVRRADPPDMSQSGGDGHAWSYGPVCDVRGRKLYRGWYLQGYLHVYDLDAQAWSMTSTPSTPPAGIAGTFHGHTFFYERGSAGQVIVLGQNAGTTAALYSYDVATATWASINNAVPNQLAYSFVQYSPVHRLALIGSEDSTGLSRMDSQGNLTAAATPPCVIRNSREGFIHPDPATGKFVLLCQFKAMHWHIYDPIANTYTDKGDATGIPAHPYNLPSESPSTGDVWGTNAIPIWDHGVIMYVKCGSVAQSCQVSLYKGGTFTAADRSFKQRCYAPGVSACYGFDSPNDWVIGPGTSQGAYGANYGYMPPSGTTNFTRAGLQSAQKASGPSALRFTIPSGSGSDIAGSWFTNFSEDRLRQFGAGEQFYLQWRQRFSPELLNTLYTRVAGGKAGGWKTTITGEGDPPGPTCTLSINSGCASSCTTTDIVTQNTDQRGFHQMYNSCTGSASHGPYDPLIEAFTGEFGLDYKLQNGRPTPFCTYLQQWQLGVQGGAVPAGNCALYVPNEWMTFKVQVQLGTCSGDEWINSHINAWVSRDGQAPVQVFNFGPYNLTAGSGCPKKIGKIWLTPYHTDKDPLQVHAEAQTYYDELIVSTQDIANPGAAAVSSLCP